MTLDKAQEILADFITPEGELYGLGAYLSWAKGRKYIVLDGEFDIEMLEALVVYTKAQR